MEVPPLEAERSISVTSRSAGNLDLFTVGRDGIVYTTWWYAGNEWGAVSDDWRRIGGFFPAGAAGTAISKSPNSIDLFVTGNDGRVYTSWWYEGQEWSGIHDNWRPLAPAPAPAGDVLEFDFPSITFDSGVPVGGFAHLTLRRDGTYKFSGHFHDSGATEYNVAAVIAVKDSANLVYTFQHQGHASGTFEPGSRDDDWSNDGQNADLANHWASFTTATQARLEASARLDMVNLTNSLIGTLGTVLGVIAIVAA
jgi:hypothetical protein